MQRVLEEWSEIKAPRPAEILREHGYKARSIWSSVACARCAPPAERRAFRPG
jgi:hypothetical protein